MQAGRYMPATRRRSLDAMIGGGGGPPRARLSRTLVALLHVAPAELGVDEETRRTVQRNVGGSESAATMSIAGAHAVLAWWEERGWVDRRHAAGHWRRTADDELRPLRHKAVKLADVLGWTDPATGRVDWARLDALVVRQTDGRRSRLADCDRRELYEMVECLKAMCRREPAAAERLRA